MEKLLKIEWAEKTMFDNTILSIYKKELEQRNFKVTELLQSTEYCECQMKQPSTPYGGFCGNCDKPIFPTSRKPKIEKLDEFQNPAEYALLIRKLNEIIEHINKEAK